MLYNIHIRLLAELIRPSFYSDLLFTFYKYYSKNFLFLQVERLGLEPKRQPYQDCMITFSSPFYKNYALTLHHLPAYYEAEVEITSTPVFIAEHNLRPQRASPGILQLTYRVVDRCSSHEFA